MIVTLNDNNSDKYLNLFTEAYEYLKGLDNGYVDIDKERFYSLAEYYSHMADFFENQKYKYVMLPLDEEPFLIDLNTRSIAVPQSFSKCASVQKDQLAETIVFIVDRYYDYMDLANAEIYVQWTIPENKKLNIEEYNGATRVEMIDLETEPGKIKFAWPLNDKITAVPGQVKFSVRFFRIDNSNPNKLLYSLNTVDSTIIIKEALQPDLNVESEVESPVSDDSFKKAILNSLFAEEGIELPKQPTYMSPGSNISADTMIEVNDIKIVSLDNDTITLKVQAIVADAGEITYKWYYKGQDGVYYDCENYPEFDSDGQVIEGTSTTFGTVGDAFVEFEEQPIERVQGERYYQADDLGAYKLYTGNIPADVTLYERYSTFTVPTSGNITGYYQAAAWNNITSANGKILTTQYPTRSEACLLPGPSTIMFKVSGNLPDGKILTLVDGELNKYNAILAIDLEEDKYQPKLSYEWRTSTVSPDDVVDEGTEIFKLTEEPKLIADKVGWYSVRVVSELNREVIHQFSNICKVTKFPKPPVIEVQEHQLVSIKNEPVTFKIAASVDNSEGINEKLLNDSYTYIWQILLPDLDDYITIPQGYTGVDGIGTDSLTVNNKIKTSSANFRCLVVNNLNGEKALFDHSGTYNPSSSSPYGDFKAESPYIYENTEDNFVFTIINY